MATMTTRTILPWLTAAIILCIVFGTAGVMVKTAQRVAANNPQIQLAEDTAAKLRSGATPQSLVTDKIDFERSLAPFIVIYDTSGKPLTGTGYLGGQLPDVPIGVLKAADGKDHSAVTWQPRSDTRIAAAIASSGNYYVLSGRSLREVEREESVTYLLAAIGLGASLVVLLVGYILTRTIKATKGA